MMMCNGQRETYLPLISQRVSSHLSGHTLLIKDAFWQPVAGNEIFCCCCRLIMSVKKKRKTSPNTSGFTEEGSWAE
uniref:Uncharacterized protein n=1 Tax=Poecilia latipinna TaxID=48699 RepID=A0A3B3UBC9_9TELE